MKTAAWRFLLLGGGVWLMLAARGATQPADQPPTVPLQQRAIALYRTGHYDQAIPLYQQLATLRPNDLAIVRDLMWVLWRAQRFQEAGETAAQLTTRRPDDVEALNLLGRAQLLAGDNAGALKTFERSVLVAPDQFNVWFMIAKLYVELRQYAVAMTLLDKLAAQAADHPEIYPVLARTQLLQGDFAASAQTWAQAVQWFPDRTAYQFHEAEALFHAGATAEALTKFYALLAHDPTHRAALEFVADYLITQHQTAEALRLLEHHLTAPQPGDERLWLQLARLQLTTSPSEQYLATLDRALALNPRYGEALLLKADYFRQQGRLAAAARIYRQILMDNPWSFRARSGLTETLTARGDHARALATITQARMLDPTDPYLLLRELSARYAMGSPGARKEALRTWLKANRPPIVPVLVYHGLTDRPDDPLLATPIHMTQETFADHIRALQQAGFTAITTEELLAWSQGKADLPPHPVLITFDDARRDSFQHADPVLAQYGFQATMFVPITNVDRNLPGYASWQEIERHAQTGRWDMQSHGDLASTYIPIDAAGHRGPFLVYRQWLADEERLETIAEWSARVLADLTNSQLKIAQHTGKAPVAFAYPFSDFGQESIPNFPEAAPRNLAIARRVYGLVFHRDRHGVNVRTKDPILFTRLTPLQHWTGRDLLWHFRYQDPFLRTSLAVIRQATWDRRFREAQRWLRELRRYGAPEALLMAEEARIYFAGGDHATGRALSQQALQMDQSPQVQQIVQAIQRAAPEILWAPEVLFQADNRERERWLARQSLGHWRFVGLDWGLRHRSGLYREGGFEDVVEHGAGLRIAKSLGLYHALMLETIGHVLSADENRGAFTALGGWRAQWTDTVGTQVEVGHAPVWTARALDAEVNDRYVQLVTTWRTEGPWGLRVSGRAADISDDNRRYQTTAEVSYRLGFLPQVTTLYRVTAADTERVSPNYYSPQRLVQYQVGAEYTTDLWRWIGLSARYLPGYGDEDGVDPRFIQTADLALPLKWRGRTWLRPSVAVSRSPTYRSTTYGVSATLRF